MQNRRKIVKDIARYQISDPEKAIMMMQHVALIRIEWTSFEWLQMVVELQGIERIGSEDNNNMVGVD